MGDTLDCPYCGNTRVTTDSITVTADTLLHKHTCDDCEKVFYTPV